VENGPILKGSKTKIEQFTSKETLDALIFSPILPRQKEIPEERMAI
jgi:hypothetical protein